MSIHVLHSTRSLIIKEGARDLLFSIFLCILISSHSTTSHHHGKIQGGELYLYQHELHLIDSWQKLSQLRAEVEAANVRADEAEAKVKKLEEEHIQKEHETSSLESRVKLLQEQLDKAESDFKEASEKYVFGTWGDGTLFIDIYPLIQFP